MPVRILPYRRSPLHQRPARLGIESCRWMPKAWYVRPPSTLLLAPIVERKLRISTPQPLSSLAIRNGSRSFTIRPARTCYAKLSLTTYDVRIAAQRVLEQQAQVSVTRAAQFPTLNAGRKLQRTSSARRSAGGEHIQQLQLEHDATTSYAGGLTASAAWNLDFWGQYRRQTEAARAQLLATQWGSRRRFELR